MNLNQREMRTELRRQVDEAGGVMAWSRAKGLSHAPVSWALSGSRPVTESVANAAGFLVETTYKKVS